jgi:hypothetical protein
MSEVAEAAAGASTPRTSNAIAPVDFVRVVGTVAKA